MAALEENMTEMMIKEERFEKEIEDLGQQIKDYESKIGELEE